MKFNFSDLQLEKYVLNELDSELMININELLKTDNVLAQKIERIKNENEAFTSDIYRNELKYIKSLVESRTSKYSRVENLKKYFQFSHMLKFSTVIGCFMFVVLSLPFINLADKKTIESTERIKGHRPHLEIYKKHDNRVTRLYNNSVVKRGDLLQVSYIGAAQKYGVILSIDGNKTVSIHYPSSDNYMGKLIKNNSVILSNSFELDGSPKFERFFFFTSNKKIKIKRILDLINKSEKKEVPFNIGDLNITYQFSLNLNKK